MTPILIDTVYLKDSYRNMSIYVTSTFDGFYTIWSNTDTNIVIDNNYPRFTSVEKVEEYWNKIKHKFKCIQ